MKVPLSWLHEFIDIDLPVAELIEFMGRNGLEVEEVHTPGAGAEGIRVARVLHRAPHPDADKLQVVRITTDGEDEVELVCGATNFEVGDIVAWAGPGSTIPAPPGQDAPMRLEARPLRGVVSNGMLASARELQLADDHDGILLLPSSTPLGIDLTELLPLGEPVIEVAVMADRGDEHSILGIARVLGAMLDAPVRFPDVASFAAQPRADVAIDIVATDGCSHFSAWALDGVTVGPSPWQMRQRLAQCGIRSISNAVDVTNYVMLELGQPLHAFDLDTIAGPELHIRWAQPGERLTTLDDAERELATDELVIADADGPVSLAGVMGGASTEVTTATTRVLFEAAIWDPKTIRRTSRRLNLISEASLRFERRVDPLGAHRAVARAAGLLAEISGATHAGVAEDGAPTWVAPTVTLDPVWCAGFLGMPDLAPSTQAELLGRGGCDVAASDGALTVVPPSWRADLSRPADLAEEIAQLHGYDRIPATLPLAGTTGRLTLTQQAEREVHRLAQAAGFDEVVTRPFVGDEAIDGAVPDPDRVVLTNPLAQDASAMRPTLAEGLLQVVRRNVGQGRPGVAVYELGRVFRQAGGPADHAMKHFGDRWRWEGPDAQTLPTQPRVLGLAAQGLRFGDDWLDQDATWSVYDVLAVLDDVVDRLGPAGAGWTLEREPAQRPGYHPGRSAVLRLDGVEVGFAGQLHPLEAERRDLVEPVIVAELVLEPLLDHLGGEDASTSVVQAVAMVKHPAMNLDVALVADETIAYATLETAVRTGAGELLDALYFFDEYRGAQLGEGKRSIALRLRLQSAERQLDDGDAERVIAAVATAAERVGASLRG